MRAQFIHTFLSTIREHQRRNQFLDRAYKTDLSLLDGPILVSADQKAFTIEELSQLLLVPRSTLARQIKSLVHAGKLRMEVDPDDKRARKLFLTASGEALVNEFHNRANSQFETFLENLSSDEGYELTHLIARYADGLGVEPLNLKRASHPLRSQIARHTAGMRLLNRTTLLYGGLSALEWHVLAVLEKNTNIIAKDICTQLKISAAALSPIMSMWKRQGHVQREKRPTDKRSYYLKLTPSGYALLKTIDAKSLDSLSPGLNSFSLEELERLATLWTKFVGVSPLVSTGQALLQARLIAQELAGPEDRSIARELLVHESAKLGTARALPELLFGQESRCYGLLEEDTLLAAFEIQAASPYPILRNYVVRASTNSVTCDRLEAFSSFALREYFAKDPARTISVDPSIRVFKPYPTMFAENRIESSNL